MLYLGYIKYICQYVPFVFLQNTKFYAEDCVLVVPSSHTYYVSLFLKYSYFFKRCSLIDLGGYDMPTSGLFVKGSNPNQPTTQHTPTL